MSSLNVERAIIPVAGFGTRRLPIGKAIEKCMLPVNDRPVVDYAVEDCIKAGAHEITFVVSGNSNQLQTYYGHNLALESYLRHKGKEELLEQVLQIGQRATFNYVKQQGPKDAYGTAIPVAMFAGEIGLDEQVLVAMGDDFVYNADDSSEMARLIKATHTQGNTAGLLAAVATAQEVHKYGLIQTIPTPNGGHIFESIVEKPEPGAASSNLINISKYLFDRPLFDCAVEVVESPPAPGGEHPITTAFELYLQHGHGDIAVVPANGKFFDCGNKHGWLAANNVLMNT